MRFRLAVFLAGFSAAAFGAAQAQAEKFQIMGGMGDGSGGGMARILDFANTAPVDLRKQEIELQTDLPPGSIVINTMLRKLYFIMPEGKAMMYPVGVGREGYAWSGSNVITRKAEWPEWRPPKEMIAREASHGTYLPVLMKGGEDNPLGARALYIGDTQYRIHGTTRPSTIGRAVSSGCIRMLNEHVIDLYDRVIIGARVVVQ